MDGVFTNSQELAKLASEVLLCETKKISNKMLSPVSIKLGTSAIPIGCLSN